MVKVSCKKCKHVWNTKSELWLVTCPGCGLKVKNPRKRVNEEKKDGR